MDANKPERQRSHQLIRTTEVEPEIPPASGDSKGKWNEQAHESGNTLLAQEPESTLTNNLRRDQPPKARDQRLHSDGKQNEGNAKVDLQETRSRLAAEERAGQAHRAKHP